MNNQRMLYVVIGVLAVVVAALAIYILREESRPDGVEIKIDGNGISVQEN